MSKVICPYCNNPAKLMTGEKMYPHRKDLFSRYFWQCKPCKAHVGCHRTSSHPNGRTGTKPLGTLATANLRYMRSRCHRLFDPLWRDGKIRRRNAYKILACKLEITTKECHISWFDESMCKKMIQLYK